MNEFGQESSEHLLVSMAKVLFINNISEIYCIAPSTKVKPTLQNYLDAFRIIECTSGFYSIVCDTQDQAIISLFAKSLENFLKANSPKIGFVGIDNDYKNALSIAKAINNPRMCLAFPDSFCENNPNIVSSAITATALACTVATNNKFKNLTVPHIKPVKTLFDKDKIITLHTNGISIVRSLNNKTIVEKVVTAGKINANLPSDIYYLLTFDNILNDIIRYVEEVKKKSTFNLVSRRALLSQVICILLKKRSLNLISSFDIPKVNYGLNSSISISVSINLFYLDQDIPIVLNLVI